MKSKLSTNRWDTLYIQRRITNFLIKLRNMHQELISWLLIITLLMVIVGSICLAVAYFILNIIVDALIVGFYNKYLGLKNTASELNRIGFRKKKYM